MKKQIEPRPSIKDWEHDEFVEAVSQQVFNSEEQASALWMTLSRKGRNLLMYGPGGYAKSMILEVGLGLVTDNFYSETHLQTAAPGMPMEPFIGSLDYPTWKTSGVANYIVNNTVFLCGKRWAILEEGLSAPPKVLLALRDALMRGYLCIDGVCTPNTLENFFIATNVYPSAWVKSLRAEEQVGGKALLNRFHRQVEVVWKDHSTKTWNEFFNHQYGKTSLLAEMIGEAWNEGHQINPRTASQLFVEYEEFGIKGLRNFDGVPPVVYGIFQRVEARAPYLSAILEMEKVIKKAQDVLSVKGSSKAVVGKAALDIVAAQNDLRSLKIPSDTKYTERLKEINSTLNSLLQQLNAAHKTAPERTIL